MNPNDFYVMTWEELINRSQELQDQIYRHFGEYKRLKVYGVPKGGLLLASVFTKFGWNEIVYDPNLADIIVDDIIDSGSTKNKYVSLYNKPFFALIDKQNNEEHKKLSWIIFPWESAKLDSIDDNIIRILQWNKVSLDQFESLKSHINFFFEKLKENC